MSLNCPTFTVSNEFNRDSFWGLREYSGIRSHSKNKNFHTANNESERRLCFRKLFTHRNVFDEIAPREHH